MGEAFENTQKCECIYVCVLSVNNIHNIERSEIETEKELREKMRTGAQDTKAGG